MTAYSQKTFESIKHIDENGAEFWLARKLQIALEYAQWRRFLESVERAKTACEASGLDVADHFADVGKMIDLAKGAQREIADIKLSRYACDLIVMNGDPRKEVIALGQTYFAVRTRQQEICRTRRNDARKSPYSRKKCESVEERALKRSDEEIASLLVFFEFGFVLGFVHLSSAISLLHNYSFFYQSRNNFAARQ